MAVRLTYTGGHPWKQQPLASWGLTMQTKPVPSQYYHLKSTSLRRSSLMNKPVGGDFVATSHISLLNCITLLFTQSTGRSCFRRPHCRQKQVAECCCHSSGSHLYDSSESLRRPYSTGH